MDAATAASLQGARPNGLLAGLPAADREALSESLQWVPLRLGDRLHEPGIVPAHAYFPSTAVVALHHVTRDGACAQTASIGHEGVVGLALFLGGGSTGSGAVVHSGGHGWRIAAPTLVAAFGRSPPLRHALLRHTQGLMAQVAQTAACYRHHSVEQQLAGWLLATAARLPDAELVITQELLSHLLGVRRESITQAAGRLQAMQLIGYRRGHISVLQAAGLRDRACECHGVMQAEMQRLAPSRP